MSMRKLLIVEDEPSVARQLQWGLSGEYDVTVAHDAEEARHLLSSASFPVVTLDLGLPPFPDIPKVGLQMLEEGVFPASSKVIVITGNAEDEVAVRAVAMGVTDFCPKPVDLKVLEVIIQRAYRMHELSEAGRRREQQDADHSEIFCGMVGNSPVMADLFVRIRKISGTDFPVLITGESGTGKEMIAHAIHALSKRKGKPFVIINCGAIPENLIESELFGHEKGAFTGAHCTRKGKVEEAQTGTIFFDEVGELPLGLQVKLLRLLQEGTIERVGGRRSIPLDLRFVAATNVDLEQAVAMGRFRQDLFYRLNVVPLSAPPLRERREDIPRLASFFLDEECGKLRLGRMSFSPSALKVLGNHAWPGNVRELRNAVLRALATVAGSVITPAELGLDRVKEEGPGSAELDSLAETRRKAEAEAVRQAMVASGNNISQAARLLSVSRPTMHDLLRKHMPEF